MLFSLVCVCALSGCAVTTHGLVKAQGDELRLLDGDGKTWRVGLHGEAAWLAYMDGVFVEVDGTRGLRRRVQVSQFRVHEGAHGLQAWLGVLRDDQGQLGVNDRSSGGYWAIDEEAREGLRPMLGKPVLLEGYVSGAHLIHVVYYRPLFD